MKNYWFAALLLIPALALADGDISRVNRSIRVDSGQVVGDVSSVNGSITIQDGATAEDVQTVNGSVTIEDRVTVRGIDTVNGGIRLGDQVKAESVETVNGRISVGEGSQVSGDITAVNGSIELEKNADVRGRVENVNGSMQFDAAHVGGGLKTTNGSITVNSGSRIEGGILVKKPQNTGWFNNQKRPTITIGPNAVVEGNLKFEHEVDLFVSDRAKIGPVSGATAITFSGNEPSSADREKVEK